MTRHPFIGDVILRWRAAQRAAEQRAADKVHRDVRAALIEDETLVSASRQGVA